MLPKLRIASLGILAAVAIITSACSSSRGTDQAQSAQKSGTSDTTLSLKGPQDSVGPGGQAYVQAFYGTPPYSYYMVSGKGSVEFDTGLFTADLSQGTVVVGVRDSAGKTDTVTFSVGLGWGSSVLLKTDYPTITVTQKVTLSATGGSAPYYFAVSNGVGRMISDTVYEAPATTGTVTLVVVDSIGGTNSTTFTIQAATALTLTPTTKSMLAGSQYTFTASGGVPPYNWSLLGGGAISKGKYTASLIAGPARVQVKDGQGSISYSDITITPNYSTSHQSANFSLIVDQYLAFSFDNSTDQEHPNFTFWGSGPLADATDPGKNCSPLTGQCLYVVTLNNFSNSNFAYATYRGTIGTAGRSGGAHLAFCIDPADTTRAKVRWEDGAGFTSAVRYNLPNKTLFGGVPTISAFSLVDAGTAAGNATINFDGAYTADIDCADFTGATEVVVNPH